MNENKQREILIRKMIITVHQLYHQAPSGGETKEMAKLRYDKILRLLNGICLSASDDCPVLETVIDMADTVEEKDFLQDTVKQEKVYAQIMDTFNWATKGSKND